MSLSVPSRVHRRQGEALATSSGVSVPAAGGGQGLLEAPEIHRFAAAIERVAELLDLPVKLGVAVAPGELPCIHPGLAPFEPGQESVMRHPKVAASKLAPELGRERKPFKADVRKLKKLGLTLSFEVGYEISPRGKVFLKKRKPTRSG